MKSNLPKFKKVIIKNIKPPKEVIVFDEKKLLKILADWKVMQN